jgi:hypothetical protein
MPFNTWKCLTRRLKPAVPAASCAAHANRQRTNVAGGRKAPFVHVALPVLQSIGCGSDAPLRSDRALSARFEKLIHTRW